MQLAATVAPAISAEVAELLTVPEIEPFDAARYGPTTGPPVGEPAGMTSSDEVSSSARARLTRPLPAPPGSAVRARRPMRVPLDAPGSALRRRAVAPATTAAEAEVPVTERTEPSVPAAAMSTAGAEMKAAVLALLPAHRTSS